jgi:hypothetical protein
MGFSDGRLYFLLGRCFCRQRDKESMMWLTVFFSKSACRINSASRFLAQGHQRIFHVDLEVPLATARFIL